MENKKEYTKTLETLLKSDERSRVVSCEYSDRNGFDRTEYVTIIFDGGYMAKIIVTANSLGAIMKEVANEVYGNGAVGTCYRGFCKEARA